MVRLLVVSALFLLSGGPARPQVTEARPWLGVSLKETAGGVLVESVFPGSPAEGAGLHAGDILRRVNGIAPARPEDVVRAVEKAGVGATLKIVVLPKGQSSPREITIKLDVRPELRALQRTTLVGRTAPDFEIRKATGLFAPTLRDLKGQVVLLDFWASWCMPCIAALPHLQALHDRLGAKGLRVVGVSSDDWDQVSAVVRKHRLTYGQISDPDGEIGSRYLVTSIPTLVLIGRDGNVLDVAIGGPGSIEETLAKILP